MNSTPICPKCGTELKEDFGMATCPSCGSMLFIDMDGLAHLSTDEPAAPEAAGAHHSIDVTPDVDAAPAFEPQPDEAFPGAVLEEEMTPDAEASHDSAHEAAGDDAELNMDNFLGFENENAGANAEGAHQDVSPVDNDSLDISGYANSEVSQAKDGPLVINVLISGIDSKEMRQSIREAIEDSRFGWDAQKLMSRINKGQLKIAGLSPVKASILINRIKRLPIEIRWEQNAVTQMEGS